MENVFPEIEEFFIYNPKAGYGANPMKTGGNNGIKMTRDSVTYCTSGLVDRNKGSTLSYLLKQLNLSINSVE